MKLNIMDYDVKILQNNAELLVTISKILVFVDMYQLSFRYSSENHNKCCGIFVDDWYAPMPTRISHTRFDAAPKISFNEKFFLEGKEDLSLVLNTTGIEGLKELLKVLDYMTHEELKELNSSTDSYTILAE